MADEKSIWESENQQQHLKNRVAGFWHSDYLSSVILPLLDIKPGARILDAGCGTGSLSLLLARLLPHAHIVGVDITATMIEAAQQEAASAGLTNVEFRQGDALNLPFAGASFDAAVCQTLLIHLTEPLRAVQEMSRVLASGGKFMAAEYHTLSVEWPIDQSYRYSTDEQSAEAAKYTQMVIRGFRKSGHGDIRIGGQVPFLALEAGLQVMDVRINDRVTHSFPPYDHPAQTASRTEAQSVVMTHANPQWRDWLAAAMIAGGGSASDVDRFLALMPEQQRSILAAGREDYAFLWLINPVLLITVARKP